MADGMSDLPTLVFVPGAWHRPTCYNKIIELLQNKHQIKCISITLPSTKGDPSATFKDDLDVAQSAIARETIQGRNVVIIAHSYGGIVGNSAVKGFTRPHAHDSEHTSSGYVVGIVLIASGFALTGLSFMDPLFGIPPPQWRINKDTGFAEIVKSPREVFYHDIPVDEANYWVSQLTPQSLKALFEGGEYTYSGWLDVPAWYIGTVEDRGLPVLLQRMQVGMAREMGGLVEHREMQTSHSPFLSQPDEVVGLLTEVIEAFMGRAVEGRMHDAVIKANVVVPAARMFQPSTWVKFGLPFAFGRLLGRCYLSFNWFRRSWG
jgi:pimeloyl-ACP methyl ester carboxylesterase